MGAGATDQTLVLDAAESRVVLRARLAPKFGRVREASWQVATMDSVSAAAVEHVAGWVDAGAVVSVPGEEPSDWAMQGDGDFYLATLFDASVDGSVAPSRWWRLWVGSTHGDTAFVGVRELELTVHGSPGDCWLVVSDSDAAESDAAATSESASAGGGEASAAEGEGEEDSFADLQSDALDVIAVSGTSERSDVSFLLDGDLGTEWIAAGATDQWVVFDLGARYEVVRVTLYRRIARARDVELQIANGDDDNDDAAEVDASTAWTTVAAVNFASLDDARASAGAIVLEPTHADPGSSVRARFWRLFLRSAFGGNFPGLRGAVFFGRLARTAAGILD